MPAPARSWLSRPFRVPAPFAGHSVPNRRRFNSERLRFDTAGRNALRSLARRNARQTSEKSTTCCTIAEHAINSVQCIVAALHVLPLCSSTGHLAVTAPPRIPMQTSPPRDRNQNTSAALAVTSLTILFLWVYGRFAFDLYFVMDDYIHAAGEMTGPLWATLRDTFTGAISWSGYRPLTTAMRVLLFHAFGMEQMGAYYMLYLALHLVNTLLAFRIVRRAGAGVPWAFFAAAVVLLLPSHNEAVFWFAANSNPLALFFCLLALDFALTSFGAGALPAQLAAAAAYICAVLAYEVTFALPLLILLADWIRSGRDLRKHLRLYWLLAGAAVALLTLRLLVQNGSLVPSRTDYAASLDPGHIVRGFELLLSQMVLLYNSPFPGAPTFAWSRNWLEPTGPLALATIALTLLLVITTFAYGARNRDSSGTADSGATKSALLWVGWGLIWIVVMGFAFASLTGRNPENRYTYLLSFGFSVALTAFFFALYQSLRKVRALQFALVGLMSGLLAFYAYTSVSDATDRAAAGALVRSVQETIGSSIPALEPNQSIGQIGIPAQVGSAYTYSIERAFQDAMSLHYGQGRPGFADNASLRTWFTANPAAGEDTYAFAWNSATQGVTPLVAVILCKTFDDCQYHELRRPDGSSKNRGLRYVQIYDTDNPQLGGVALLATLQPYAVQACYIFQDYNVPTDTYAFSDYPQDQRCDDAVSAFWDYSE